MSEPKIDCPLCQGSGAYYGTNPVCCGRPDHRGDCCGNPEPEVVQCSCASLAAAERRDYRDGDVSTDELIGGNS